MKLLKDQYYILADAEDNYKIKGTKIHLLTDPDFNPGAIYNATTVGEVYIAPERVAPRRKRYDGKGMPYYDGFFNHTPLKTGDKVYFTHAVVKKDNEHTLPDGRKIYLCHHRDLICVVREEKILVLEDWVLAEPALEPIENAEEEIETPNGKIVLALKPEREKMDQQMIVLHLSPPAEEEGLHIGDQLHHRKDIDYDVIIEGKVMHRVALNYINGTFINK